MKPYKKTQKQAELTRLMAAYAFLMAYGGSRSGKTFQILRNILIRACKRESRHLVARYRLKHLKGAIIHDTLPKVIKLCFPQLPPVERMLNKSDLFLQLPNRSEIWFGGLDDSDRVDKILGNEYSTIFVNEATQVSWETITTVLTRLAENAGLVNRFIADCNPASTKHWTSTVFMKGIDPITEEPIPNFDDYASLQINPMDNLDNLPPSYLKLLEGLPKKAKKRFLAGLFQDDVEGALWTMLMCERALAKEPGKIVKTVIGVDPSVSNNKGSDECGIVAASLDENDEGIIHEDASIKASTQTWAARAVNLHHKYDANYIVAETNNGGDLVVDAIKNVDKTVKVKKVHAAKGKKARAEPVSQLYELECISHDQRMPKLEDEFTEWVPDNTTESPNRLDAAVWALTELMIKPGGRERRVMVVK